MSSYLRVQLENSTAFIKPTPRFNGAMSDSGNTGLRSSGTTLCPRGHGQSSAIPLWWHDIQNVISNTANNNLFKC